jgi:ferric iron reductase protein FhuF
MTRFKQTLQIQRWDDHRYYHHSRINQSLHFISALSFVAAYVLLFINPALAAIVAWCVAMTSRQAGHFFFEPRGYDHVNDVTDEHKEAIKIGYNIRRKIVLMAVTKKK